MLLLLALACSEVPIHQIPYTTARVGEYQPKSNTDLELKIYSEQRECRQLIQKSGSAPEEFDSCMPWIDRRSGEVRLAFSFQLEGDNYPLPLSPEHLDVSHAGNLVGVTNREVIGEGTERLNFEEAVEIVPHVPVQVDQLFVLMIDSSGSMNEVDGADGVTRMEKVKKALLMKSVQNAFFPDDATNRVAIFSFTEGTPTPLGGKMKLLSGKREYSELIKNNLRSSKGFTHLYRAVEYASVDFLSNPEIQNWLSIQDAVPTIVVLTDGFNNLRSSDVCSDNAKPLQQLLEELYQTRYGESVDIRFRPTIYTVGLGRPFHKKFKLPNSARTRVKSSRLCTSKYRDRRIDGDLERKGIDNASLSWIADLGGGSSFLRRDSRGLGEAFKEAASLRYRWFEVRYRVNPLLLRRDFDTILGLKTFAEASSSLRIYPSGWLDGPPGDMAEDGWTKPRGYMFVMSAIMPLLGAIVFISICGAFVYNVSRILMGRLRPPSG